MHCPWPFTIKSNPRTLAPFFIAVTAVAIGGCAIGTSQDDGAGQRQPEQTQPEPVNDTQDTQPGENTGTGTPASQSVVHDAPTTTPSDAQRADDLKARRAALAFASDISDDDPQVIARVNAAFANPRRDPEVVGFYLDDDVSDFEVAFRTAVTALNDRNFVIAFENKYANELLASMLKNDRIFPDGVDVNQQIGQYIEQLAFGMELGPDDVELDEPIFAEAVEAIETGANSNGVYFLELNLGSSNTRFIIPTSQTNYERWLNVAFDQELAVEKLTWATVWDDIAYNIYDTDTYNLPGILTYEKPYYRDARELVSP